MPNHKLLAPKRRGVMLLVVTLVLAALTLSGAALLTLMKTENEATSTRGRESIVKGVDRSAVVFLIAALESNQEEREKFGGLYDNPQYFCAASLLSKEEGGADSSHFTILSPTIVDSQIEGVRYGLVDESTRLNLEAALEWDKESPGAGRAALMKLPGMTPIAADSILDWIDPDENPRQNGAEAKYYADKKLPYSPRNSTPVFLEEILLARGVTRSQLYGTDENFTYNVDKIDPEANDPLGGSLTSAPTGRRSGAPSPSWRELLTVFSAEKDVDPTGAARVSLNGSNLEFLYNELRSRVGDDLAKFIVLYRQYGPIESGAPETNASDRRGARRASGYTRGRTSTSANATPPNATRAALSQATLDYATAPTTSLATPLDLVGARVQVGNVFYDSPLRDSRDQRNIEALFTLLDYASTSASTTIIGRVNVNVAPRAVLSAIPGVTPTMIETILDRRPNPKNAIPKEFRHASWLYAQGLVDLEQMKKLYNKTTARGDVYRGQVVGFLERSDEISRAEVVIDGTTEPPRQVFYKDLTTLGKGFSDAVLIGGKNSGSESDPNAPLVDWNKTNEIFEIEGRESGYTSANQSDPFAAVDLATGLTSQQETNTAATLANAVESATPTLTQTPSLDATSPLSQTSNLDATSQEAQSSAATTPETTQSRRERALQTLRDAREQRSARNRAAIDEANRPRAAQQTQQQEAPDADEPSAAPAPRERNATSRQPAGAQESNETSELEDRTQRALNALRGARSNRRGDEEQRVD